MRILAVSGSLRAVSHNTNLLLAAARLVPVGMELELYRGLGALPQFNPDCDDTADAAVTEWRRLVRSADALLLSCPEYAHGIPGALKNALDWLVSDTEFAGKPTGLLTASHLSVHAPAQLAEVLRTMSADLVPEACPTFSLRGESDLRRDLVADPAVAGPLQTALGALAARIRARRHPSGS
jgi:chromate reductase, NAD(P)H dehydrogenase (quinone)